MISRSPNFQIVDVSGGTSDAPLLTRVAELPSEARRAGVHRTYQRGSAAVACDEGPHRTGRQ